MEHVHWGSQEWLEAHFPADQLDTTGDIWGIRWRGGEKLRHASYVRLLDPVLKQPQPLNVLDIGCALGDFTKKAAAVNPANNFFVVDAAETAISWVKDHFPQFECQAARLPDIPFSVQFDVVLCLEVLCYLDAVGRRQAIRRMYERLTPSGVLLFSGVLDGGERHHTEEEMVGIISEHFEIERVVFNHWWFYRRFIEHPLNEVDLRLGNLKQMLDMPAVEFADRYGGGLKAGLFKTLRAANPVSGFTVGTTSKLLRWLMGSRALAEMAQVVSRPVRGTKRANEIVILARKKA